MCSLSEDFCSSTGHRAARRLQLRPLARTFMAEAFLSRIDQNSVCCEHRDLKEGIVDFDSAVDVDAV